MVKNIAAIFLIISIFGCNSDLKHDFSQEEIEKASKGFGQRSIILQNGRIRLIEIIDFPTFDDISLQLLTKNAKYVEGKNKLEFKIKGFVLGNKTVAENELNLNTEHGGQYLFVSNLKSQEVKKYNSSAEIELAQGENYLVAFLNRSYRMSLKSNNSSLLLNITTNDGDGVLKLEKTTPFLHLNEPKGVYDIVKNKNLLLDFQLFNIKLNSSTYLSVSIDDKEFKIYKWAPFYIEGLGIGKHNIKVCLKNQKGEKLGGKLLKEITREFEITDTSMFE